MMPRLFVTFLSFLLLSNCAYAQRGAPKVELTAERVRTAIRQGSEYLLAELRNTEGELGRYEGGVTALCTLALLESGVPVKEPRIQRALAFLRKVGPEKTYSVSLQTMALAKAEPRRDLLKIQKNVAWLESIQIKEGKNSGSWGYPDQPRSGGDNSCSQFAVLALHEAERVGAKVDPRTWELAADYWRRSQYPNGSWGYRTGSGTGSMTCAGIGATVICSGHIAGQSAKIENDFMQCCLPHEEDDSLERALVWMGRSFSVQRNPGVRGMGSLWHYYYLYGLERAGRLSARRFIGDHDWYREGAEFLLGEQDTLSHFWQGAQPSENNTRVTTAFALLFLSKGRRPVLMGKVLHGPGEDWQNHRNDVASLTTYVEKRWGLDLTWQIIDPELSTVEELLQTPVLFISGSQNPELAGTEDKMRDYLDRGGFLFAEACCNDGSDFETGFRKYLDQVFPEQEYKLRRAGPEHPIWRIDELVDSDSPYVGRLWTVEYGCRTCVVFSEVDLSCSWELYRRGRERDVPQAISKRISDANSIGLNVLAYATNREPKGKEAAFDLAELPELDALGTRGAIRIAKLQHSGGCNDAPGALVNLLRAAGQGELKLSVDLNEYAVSPADEALLRFHMAFMHGRHDFRFTEKEREQLREFLTNGGTLLADSICASKEFTEAFRREIALVLPENKLTRIPNDHPLLTEQAGGFDIRQVDRRDPATTKPGEPLRGPRVLKVTPELEGIEIDGRLAVIFSPYDISCALEQHEGQQCRGYTQEDAARIGLNVLLYSLSPDVGEEVSP